MNVAGDRLLEAAGTIWEMVKRAKDELALLKEIDAAEVDARAKCEAILLLLKGERQDTVLRAIAPDSSSDQQMSETATADPAVGPDEPKLSRHE